MFKYNLKLLFYRKQTFIAIFLIFLTILLHCALNIYFQANGGMVVENCLSAENQIILESVLDFKMYIVLLFPIIGALLFSDISQIEMKSRTNYLLFNRFNYKKNIVFRYFFVFLVTFMVFFLALLLEYIICLMVFKSGSDYHWLDTIGGIRNISNYNRIFMFQLFTTHPVLYMMIVISIESIVFGALSSFAYSVSLFLNKRIIIYFVPLIITAASGIFTPKKYKTYTIVKSLQPISFSNALTYILVVGVLTAAGIGIMIAGIKKKDLYL